MRSSIPACLASWSLFIGVVHAASPPGVNDECDVAIVLAVNDTCVPETGYWIGASQSLPADTCGGFASPLAVDVWYSFTATSAATVVEVQSADSNDAVLQVFSGSCGSLVALSCADETLFGGLESITLGTNIGETYYVRTYWWDYGGGIPADLDFTICVFNGPPSPANDDCGSVTTEYLSVGTSITFSGSTVGADTAGDYAPGSVLLGSGPSVWHAFMTTECANVIVNYCGTDPEFGNVWNVLATGCPADSVVYASSFDLLACGNGNTTLHFDSLAAGAYYLPVLFDADDANGPYTIEVIASSCVVGVEETGEDGGWTVATDQGGIILLYHGGPVDARFALLGMDGRMIRSESARLGDGQSHRLELPGSMATQVCILRIGIGFDDALMAGADSLRVPRPVERSLKTTRAIRDGPSRLLSFFGPHPKRPMKNAYSITAAALALLIGGGLSAQVAQKPHTAASMKKELNAITTTVHHSPGTAKSGAAPVNDLCSSVTFQALAAGSSLTFTGDLTGATIDGDYEAGSAIEAAALGSTPTLNSVWHGFSLSECADVVFSYCGITPAFGDAWIVIGTACPIGDASIIFNSSWNTTDCSDGNVTVYYAGLQPGNYYVPIMQDVSLGADGPYSVNVAAAACPVATSNDDCDDAVALTAYTFCNPYTGSNAGATESFPADSCDTYLGDAGDDTWFSFVATQTEMTVAVIGDGDFDAVIEIFDGNCSSLNQIACADMTLSGELEQEELTGLTVGQTYYVRVFHWYATAPSSDNFDICVVEGVGVNIGIEEHATIDFSVFPNPGNGDFMIQCASDAGSTMIELIDIRGSVAYKEVVNLASGTQHELKLAGQLAPGVYTLRLRSSVGQSGVRVMVR